MASTKKSGSGRSNSARKSSSGRSSGQRSSNRQSSSARRTSSRSTSSRTTNRRKKKSSSTIDFPWKSELLLFLVLAFCVILFITNIGKGGVVGEALSHFFFGIFGILAYPFPVVLFFIVAFLISNRFSREGQSGLSARAIMKLCAAVAFFLFICVFAHLVYKDGQAVALQTVFADCADHRAGGGIVGGLIGNALIRGFGLVVAYVIDFIVLVFCVVLLTEKSLFRGMQKSSERVFGDSAERRQARLQKQELAQRRRTERQANAKARREERAARRYGLDDLDDDIDNLDPGDDLLFDDVDDGAMKNVAKKKSAVKKKVTGVSFDTMIKSKKHKTPSDEIREVELEDLHTEIDQKKASIPSQDGDLEQIIRQQSEDFWGHQQEPVIHIPGEHASGEVIQKDERATAEAPEIKRHTKNPKQSLQEVNSEIWDIDKTIQENVAEQPVEYIFPDVELLQKGDPNQMGDSRQHLQEMSAKLQMTLETFGVNARVTNVICGPTVTQYEIHPEMGVKVSKILNLADDIKLNLAVPDIRIEAPIPGKAAIGIEVPNKENVTVAFRDLIESREFQNHESKISFCAGKDIAGNVIVADIAKMPHLLIAGATGSGKSVCINTIIMSILYKANPNEVKLIMIDPKVVELSVYNNIPHLLIPVVTDPKKAAGALHWAVAEMTDRYNKFAEYGVRDIKGYNKKVDLIKDIEDENKPQRMPQIVVIVDELADLMMVAPGDVEDAICRLAQLARAAGIHLIIATQRPSVNVITGLIKANMPSRIAFSVTSGVDSRTILDMNGAEKLLGKGDMLFYPQNFSKPLRVQGAFVSDKEVSDVVDAIIAQNGQVSYNSEIAKRVENSESSMGGGSGFTSSADERDTYFTEAGRFVIEKEKGSIGMLQRNFKIGFNRAARIMDQLEEAGVVGPEEGTKPRRVLMTLEEFEHLDNN